MSHSCEMKRLMQKNSPCNYATMQIPLAFSLGNSLSLSLTTSLIAFASFATGLPLVETEGGFCQAPLLPCLRAMRWGGQWGLRERPASTSIEG